MSGNAHGAIVSIIASILSNIGTNIQKEAHLQNEAKPEEDRKPYIKSALWWIGLAGVITGAIGDFVAFALASQELVVAVGCAAVLFTNVIVSTVWHKEKFGWTDSVGIVFVLGGAIIFALAAPPSEDYTAQELAHRFRQASFLVILVIQALCMLLLISTISTSRVYKLRMRCQYRCFRDIFERYTLMEEQTRSMASRLERMEERLARLDPEAASEAEEEGLQLTRDMSGSSLDEVIEESDRVVHDSMDPFVYAACSGTAGGLMAVFAGCCSKAFKQTFQGDNQFDSVWTYVFLIGLVVSILIQTHFLNRAMMHGDLMSVIPTFQAFWIVFGVLSGMAFYGHSEGMSYPGLLLMIAGVLFLLQHPRVTAGEDIISFDTCRPSCLKVQKSPVLASHDSLAEVQCAVRDEPLDTPKGGTPRGTAHQGVGLKERVEIEEVRQKEDRYLG